MKVTWRQIVQRGLQSRCPNCGEKTLFQSDHPFRLNATCSNCGMKIERDEGGFLGSLTLNYGVTVLLFLLPVLLLYLFGWIPGLLASIVAGVMAVTIPILLYRPSQSWWLMTYYLVLPHHLPANQRPLAKDEDANT